jgi:putative transposase
MENVVKRVLVGVLKGIMNEKIKGKAIVCKYCGSSLIWKYGKSRKGAQRYYCPSCNKAFLDNANLPKMSISIKQLADIIGQYYGGMSLKELKRQFKQQYSRELSRSSFDRWLRRFSKIAVQEAQKYHPNVGDKWIADECVLHIGGRKIWCWDIIDADTRFLLATHLSPTRTIKDAQILMEKAGRVANKIPLVVITDQLLAYIDGIELTWGSETKHIQSEPFTEAKISTNKIERFHSTLKTRTEIMRGLKSLKTAQALLDGWLVHYNYFRPHESLDDKSPGEEAGVKFPHKDWLDLIEHQKAVVAPKPMPNLTPREQIEYYKHPIMYKTMMKRRTKRRAKTRSKPQVSQSVSSGRRVI